MLPLFPNPFLSSLSILTRRWVTFLEGLFLSFLFLSSFPFLLATYLSAQPTAQFPLLSRAQMQVLPCLHNKSCLLPQFFFHLILLSAHNLVFFSFRWNIQVTYCISVQLLSLVFRTPYTILKWWVEFPSLTVFIMMNFPTSVHSLVYFKSDGCFFSPHWNTFGVLVLSLVHSRFSPAQWNTNCMGHYILGISQGINPHGFSWEETLIVLFCKIPNLAKLFFLTGKICVMSLRKGHRNIFP